MTNREKFEQFLLGQNITFSPPKHDENIWGSKCFCYYWHNNNAKLIARISLDYNALQCCEIVVYSTEHCWARTVFMSISDCVQILSVLLSQSHWEPK